jgi:hypothetical protein
MGAIVTSLRWFNVALRGVMEAAIVAATAYWGFWAGGTTATKLVLALLAPLLVFGMWGAVDFRFARRFAEGFRLLEELALSALAASALFVAGQPALAWMLLGTSALHHALVYACGDRLLKGERAR